MRMLFSIQIKVVGPRQPSPTFLSTPLQNLNKIHTIPNSLPPSFLLGPITAIVDQEDKNRRRTRLCELIREGRSSPFPNRGRRHTRMAPVQDSGMQQHRARRVISGKTATGNQHPPGRSSSFHGRTAMSSSWSPSDLRRPKTQPDLFAGGRRMASPDGEGERHRRLPAKVLVNVNVQRSIGALQVMASAEWTVEQLIGAAVKQYVKEGRQPPLQSTDPSAFGLHYSQFSLERLDPKEKLIGLGSRNFFLCPKINTGSAAQAVNEESTSTSSSSCSNEAEKASKIAIPWLKFMDFLF